MSRARARIALAVLALVGSAAAPAAAQAGWSAPFDLVAPGTLDFLPTQLAMSGHGSAAGYAVQDVDTPGSAQAYLVLRSRAGQVTAPQAIAGAREILALAYTSRGLELLTGASPSGLDCCSSAQAMAVTGAGRVRSTQTLVSGLTGDALGSLVPLARGEMLAVVATEGGLWTQQSGPGGRFSGRHRLTGTALSPQSMSATSLGGVSSLVAWTAASGPAGFADPRTIFYAQGSKRGSPRHTQTLLRIPAGHRIDELGVAQRATGATAAWIESYYDRHARYHVAVRATDFAAVTRGSRLLDRRRLGGRPQLWRRCRRRPGAGLESLRCRRRLHGPREHPRSLRILRGGGIAGRDRRLPDAGAERRSARPSGGRLGAGRSAGGRGGDGRPSLRRRPRALLKPVRAG